jgi:hypothetical protein
MNESEKQFSFTRVASSTSGRAKKQIPERQGEVMLLRLIFLHFCTNGRQ